MKQKDKEITIDLTSRRLKISELFLGVVIGIVISIIVECIFQIIEINKENIYIIAFICGGILGISFLIYKRIIGFPDYLEVSCNFKKNKKFDWKSFSLLFSQSINKNLYKRRYWWLKIYHWKWDSLLYKLKIKKYMVHHITRTKLGLRGIKTYIQFYKEEEKFIFLIGIPEIFGRNERIIEVFKDSMKDLEKMGVIKKDWNFSNPEYYFSSFWYPFKINGKKFEFYKEKSL